MRNPRATGEDKQKGQTSHDSREAGVHGAGTAGAQRTHTTRSEAGRDADAFSPPAYGRPMKGPPLRSLELFCDARTAWAQTGTSEAECGTVPAQEARHSQVTASAVPAAAPPASGHGASPAGVTSLTTECAAPAPTWTTWDSLAKVPCKAQDAGKPQSLLPQVRKPKRQVRCPRAPARPQPPPAAYLSVVLLCLPLGLAVGAELSQNPTEPCQSPDSGPSRRGTAGRSCVRRTPGADPGAPVSSQIAPCPLRATQGPREVPTGQSECRVRQKHTREHVPSPGAPPSLYAVSS